MASPVLNNAQLSLRVDPYPGSPTIVLQCYATALEITSSTEDVDVGVMCNASLTEQGRTTYTAVASLLWEPAVYSAIQPHVGKTCTVTFHPNVPVGAAPPTTAIKFNSRVPQPPWGRFEIGQRVEVELPLAVLSTPVYDPAWVAP